MSSKSALIRFSSYVGLLTYFFVGNYAISGVFLAPFTIIAIILLGLMLRVNGSARDLKSASILSLVFSIGFVPGLYLNSLYLNPSYAYGVLLLCFGPLIFWSLMRGLVFSSNAFPGYYRLLVLTLAAICISWVAGPNVSYRLPAAICIIILTPLQSPKFPTITLSNAYRLMLFILMFGINFYLILHRGARGGLLIVIISFMVLVFVNLLKFLNLLKNKGVFHLIINRNQIRNLISAVAVLALTLILSNPFRSYIANNFQRSALLFRYFEDRAYVTSISDGTLKREEWNSYYIFINESLSSIDFLGSSQPLWGPYPHSIGLDLLGNFGLVSLVLLIFSFLSLMYLLHHLAVLSDQFTPVFLAVILMASFLSGTTYDYYPVFLLIPIAFFVRNNIKKSKPTSK